LPRFPSLLTQLTGVRRRFADDQPLRAELFSLEQLEEHARHLAGWHQTDRGRGPDRLLPRLGDNEAALNAAYALVVEGAAAGQRVPPAADWLLDNFYLVEEQIRTARRHLPRGYSRELPRLAAGPHAGFPRVYAIVLELISHIDGRVDAESLGKFVAAYQQRAQLALGELWAIPIMLRLALIENLRRVSLHVAGSLAQRAAANAWADRMAAMAEQSPTDLVLVLADLARSELQLDSGFVAEFTRRLQGQSPALAMATSWLEQRLAQQNATIEQLVHAENQGQAADQVSIGNSISSLRSLSAMDWREFVEAQSLVEQRLRGDPGGVYARMDFATRDSYRHEVERLAKRSGLTEPQVAEHAIALARAGAGGSDERAGLVGFYLLGEGLPALERAVAARPSLGHRLAGLGRAAPLLWYLGAIAALTVLATAGVLALCHPGGRSPWGLALLAAVVALAASQWALSCVNWLATLLVTPRALPRLDFGGGIPADCRTMVVVPTMLQRSEDIDRLIEGLEVRFLANPDPHLDFALLTDFGDAPAQHLPGDEALVARACAGIDGLNAKYADHRAHIFFLFHRPRRWNEQERVWMGYERKRGKLAELNGLLLRGERDRFSVILGETSMFAKVRYIITLDTDTQLPRDAARRLVGTIAHPLNRARFGADGRVVDGYTILQPRTAINLPSAGASWFAAIFAGEPGIDPYSRAVSDVYQDLFGQGSFVGKGIYDLRAFERALHRRFPDNRILSHDLIEGCYARAGLASDVMVFEDHPSRYLADVSRRHRWTRGDWQLLPWLLGTVVDGEGRRVRNGLSALSRWKLLDNLRRSLVPLALLALLIGGWTVLPGPGGFWVVLVATLLASQVALSALVGLARKPDEVPLSMHLRNQGDATGGQLAQFGLTLIFLPFEAVMHLDAVLRTLGRLWFLRSGLLEWTTASDAERTTRRSLLGIYATMWVAPVLAGVVGWYVLEARPGQVLAALPLLALWAGAPAIAWLLSRPLRPPTHNLDAAQLRVLGQLSRKTWRFFETFVGPEDQWLPPDNYQEYPVSALAHRTSPTNLGLALLANLAAYDFGYLAPPRLLERSEKTLDTMLRMERHRGHFYNWYDTRTTKPLAPLYVSMVDSGNLVAHLLILRRGLLGLAEAPLWQAQAFAGLAHTLQCLAAAAAHAKQPPAAVAERLARLGAALEAQRGEAVSISRALVALNDLAHDAAELVTALAAGDDEELRWWAGAFEHECRNHRDWVVEAAPWCLAPPAPAYLWQIADSGGRLQDLRRELARLDAAPALEDIAKLGQGLLPLLDLLLAEHGADPSPQVAAAMKWVADLRAPLKQGGDRAAALIARLERVALQCDELADVDWSFLYDRSRELFVIGYNVSEARADRSYYDLLASEARLGSFVAIAQGKVSQDHWFSLGRLLTSSHSAPALLSWSGSMFEYLMPLLVMPTWPQTLLDQTLQAVIRRQIDYGRQRGVPWGISESGYNLTDAHLNYQYRAFGVPGLGLKRGLADDLVIAPYATVMALMVEPEEAFRNLQRIVAGFGEGQYGLYEAIDFTPARIPRGQTSATVRSFMVHHQGMSLLALAYVLLDRPMQRRFSADPLFKATELLLQERIPKAVGMMYPHAAEVGAARQAAGEAENTLRVFTSPSTSVPEVHLLSNGRYHVVVSSAGGGASRWKDVAVNRWREDPTRDHHGLFCYLRDVDQDQVWSTAHQPTLKPAKSYEAIFTQARAEFRRSDHELDTHTEIAISPEDDIELRRTTIANRSRVSRVVEVTSYGEVVLAPPAAEVAHPAFSNLFVQTRIDRQHGAILCSRRPRRASEQPPWLVHLMVVQGSEVGTASYETDRLRFVGRGRTPADPLAMRGAGPLSDSEGAVLDPVVAIRRTVALQPGESATIDLVYGMADSEAGAAALAAKYRDRRFTERVFGVAWTHSQVVLSQLGASEAESQIYGRLAGSIIYPTALRRANPSVLMTNRSGQSGLWSFGISGDLPIVLLKLGDAEKLDLVRQLVRAHSYWRMKGLVVDLVIVNEDHSVYRQAVNDQILGMIAAGPTASLIDKPGGIFVRRTDQLADEDRVLLQTVARVVVADNGGTLAQFVERRGRPEMAIPRFAPIRVHRTENLAAPVAPRRDLLFFNGQGGFTRDGKEYVLSVGPDQQTPAPWVNVIANPGFGTVVSESGGAYTWAENSHEFRLTPWHNDPVTDASGEAFYLRDEESGRYWSPMPLPARGAQRYTVRHGFGYSVFEHQEGGIACELWTYVATDAPVKFVRMKLRNLSGRVRRLSVTGYVEWVLGELRHKQHMHVVTELDRKTGALLARNPYNTEFAGRTCFFDVNEPVRTATGDRGEFLGRNGTPAQPAALGRARLSGRVGAGYDPCAALQVPLELADGQEREVVFTLGAGRTLDEAQQLAGRCHGVAAAQRALEQVWQYWAHTLGAVNVQTPDPAVDVLANGWLLYQTIACRMWARTGFYQSGGAYGFRDQLQDSMALVHAEPQLTRQHLLRAASRQFRQGDVQHWWHPPLERGVRTHFSDDFLWLPLVACRYAAATGDTGVFDERVPFIDGRPVRPEEEGYYDLPQRSEDSGTLYEHCVRAITNGLRFGAHGLPLMGCGDWNDGMNLVGEHGKGESVWLAFFLHHVLTGFAGIARQRHDQPFVERCLATAAQLEASIAAEAWDGAWYRRAFFDDGTPLGSSANQECQIDSLPQSWAVLSGAGDPQRARAGLEAAAARLAKRDARLIQLFDPPFDRSALDPGYIKGYLPGVRENGGQYTHGALWTVMAFAKLGDRERAWELFRLINPVLHADTPERIATYKVEPYVVAADVYLVAPHTGRGGWTWYTGSAGWMYRLITESLLGLEREGERLRVVPCLPVEWPSYTIHYRFRETVYHITVARAAPGEPARCVVDGAEHPDGWIPLQDDRHEHHVQVAVVEAG
jgi:cellobiose phosphorylase